MSNTPSLLQLADKYAAAHANWALEALYGTSKSYTADMLDKRNDVRGALEKAADCGAQIANAIEAEVRKQDTELIRQMFDALTAPYDGAKLHALQTAAIEAARKRLRGT